ncbi:MULTISPECIES: GerAB/ArcD/ProY family transporter [unclassified Paenibacillus]|uniref:GerAB/ArcD/ProY family transporter n=1 Tax=unclassified Paenibacillus TaxID=185978 RepID=UPI0036260BDB
MQLSGGQIFWLMTTTEIGMCILLSISPSIKEAGQDAWISIIIAGMAAMLITGMSIKISLHFPNLTFVEYSQVILGKWIGKGILLIYFVKWYSILGAILRQSTDFLHLVLFNKTPLWLVILLFVLILIYAIYHKGVESLARCSEVIGPLIVLTIILVFILNWKSMDWQRLQPVIADAGWSGIIKGSLPSMVFFSEATTIIMLVPFMIKSSDALKRTLQAIALVTGLLCISTIAIILTFGNLAAGMRYPYFTMTGFISILEFIQNIDAVVVIIWFFSVFVKLALYLFMASYGTAQWLGIKNWRKMIWFVSLIGFVIAVAFRNVDQASIDYASKYRLLIDFPLSTILIPLLLWVVFLIRKRSLNKGAN